MDYGNGSFDRVPLVDFYSLGDPKRTKKIFSRVHLALLLYLVATYAAMFLIEIIILLAAGKDAYLSVMGSSVYSLLISSGCQYAVGFPVFLLVTRGGEKAERKQGQKMPLSHLFYAFLACQTLMLVGNIIGLAINGIVGVFLGEAPENSVDALVSSTPVWLLALLVVVVAPIVEELIFRKVMIDRLALFGDRTAIVASAVAFGFFHGNLYQIFYAFLIGLVFGYVYTRTRNVWYSIGLHAVINFLGSVVSLYISKAMERIEELAALIEEGVQVDRLEYGLLVGLETAYGLINMALFALGAVVIGVFIHKKGLQEISRRGEIFIPKGRTFSYAFFNVGTLLFYIASVALIFLNLVSQLFA